MRQTHINYPEVGLEVDAMGSRLVARLQRRQLLVSGLLLAVFLSLGVWFTLIKTVTLVVDHDHQPITTWKTRVDDVLLDAGIVLQEGDVVEPALGQKLVKGMEIRVQRSFPVTIRVDDEVVATKFIGGTVAELLAKQDIALGEWDRVEPDLEEWLDGDSVTNIHITRVSKERVAVEREVAHGSKQWAEPTLEKGKTKIVRKGQPGIVQDIFEVTYENGQEVHRSLVDSIVIQEAKDEIIGLGTREVWKTLNVSGGAIRYRGLHEMTATAYYPGPESTGKWADGYTATGVKAGFGVAAVDPKVIPLGSRLYVPGYGHALAADVGGAIKGKRIDLCFETYQEAIQYGRRKVKVYILD